MTTGWQAKAHEVQASGRLLALRRELESNHASEMQCVRDETQALVAEAGAQLTAAEQEGVKAQQQIARFVVGEYTAATSYYFLLLLASPARV